MAQDDYFSFGDEELEGELELADLGRDQPDQDLALVEPPDAGEVRADEDRFGPAAKRAARPRGDSKKGSSERRRPSSRRTRIFAALALGFLALFLGGIAISGLSGGEPAVQDQASTSTAPPVAPSAADLEARRAETIGSSRERTAERQRALQHRAQTRRHARRHRQRRTAERRQRVKQRLAKEEAASAVEGPAPEYVPPTYEPAPPPSSPAPEPAPGPPTEIHSGASSPEFGL